MRTPRLFPTRPRATEATPAQLVATGAGAGWGADPIDGDLGYRRLGGSARATPAWTLEKSRAYSVAGYRSNPMARAIIDTYVSFAVGDSGVAYTVTNDEVRAVVEDFWNDPRVRLGATQDAWLRDHLIMGETVAELLVGPLSGTVRLSPIDPSRVLDVTLLHGNPLWPAGLVIDELGSTPLPVMGVNDLTGLRDGRVAFWPSFKALLTDRRGEPFLTPVLDWLDSYDTVLSNLIDRTALARYLVWDVEVQGDQKDVDAFVSARGGLHVPRSGSIEVHNQQVTWTPKMAEAGAYEDKQTAGTTLTQVAAGAGLAKTWLAEPEDANRATSLTMAEPVRRRVGAVQNAWLGYQTELLQYVVDRAVAARRLPALVASTDRTTGTSSQVSPARTVRITGPEVAAADAEVTARILVQLSGALQRMVAAELLSPDAAKVAAKKAWEGYAGVPYTADLDRPDGSTADDIAAEIDQAEAARRAA